MFVRLVASNEPERCSHEHKKPDDTADNAPNDSCDVSSMRASVRAVATC